MQIDIIFQLLVLLFSVIVHEVAHGYAAYLQGDPTAKYENRLTLNPIRHIDPIGSIVVPFFLYISGLPIFGWAKPVPYNPYNLRNQRWGEAIVAFAGPLTNIVIVLIAGLTLRFAGLDLPLGAQAILQIIVIINLMLAVFNLMPVPPLDGSKILFAFLPPHFARFRGMLESYSMIFVIIFIFVLWRFIAPIIFYLFSLITGIPTV